VTADLEANERPPGTPAGRARRRLAAVVVLALGLAGFAVSITGMVTDVLPRHFTAAQQRQIMAWEVISRWRELPAGQIFPASIGYQLPAAAVGQLEPLDLAALRIAIAPQTGCAAGVTSAAAAAVLLRSGCETVLRATYVDATRSYVMTVGVAVLPTHAAAVVAGEGLARPELAAAREAGGSAGSGGWGRLSAGVLVVSFRGTVARMYDYSRQIAGSLTTGPYVIMYAAGYSDGRPRVPVTQDTYSAVEMTSMARGVAQRVADRLGAPPDPPHCPGTPGC
jgi:hypothetical protein